MDLRTALKEPTSEMGVHEALEGVVLTVLERLRNGEIEDTIACFAEEFSRLDEISLDAWAACSLCMIHMRVAAHL